MASGVHLIKGMGHKDATLYRPEGARRDLTVLKNAQVSPATGQISSLCSLCRAFLRSSTGDRKERQGMNPCPTCQVEG